ncbi:hypothetical protein MNEG_12426, partial [Monoraphidium neglectum]
MLPPNIIAAFLQQQQGASAENDDGGRADRALTQPPLRQLARQGRRSLPRWLRRALVVAANAGVLAAGIAIGRAIHINYM